MRKIILLTEGNLVSNIEHNCSFKWKCAFISDVLTINLFVLNLAN